MQPLYGVGSPEPPPVTAALTGLAPCARGRSTVRAIEDHQTKQRARSSPCSGSSLLAAGTHNTSRTKDTLRATGYATIQPEGLSTPLLPGGPQRLLDAALRDPQPPGYLSALEALSGHSHGFCAPLGGPGLVLRAGHGSGLPATLFVTLAVPPAALVVRDDRLEAALLLGRDLQPLDDRLVLELVAGAHREAVPLDPLSGLVLAGGAEDGVHLGVGVSGRPPSDLFREGVQLPAENLGRGDPAHRRPGQEQPPVAEVRHRLPEPPELPEGLQVA